MEWTIPAFAFSAEAAPHLPTPEGWKAELAYGTTAVSKQSAKDRYVIAITTNLRDDDDDDDDDHWFHNVSL